MKEQIILKPEAEGTHNGREYKGIVIAICGKHKGISRCYMPDVYDEVKGLGIALSRLYIKESKAKVARLDWEAGIHNDMMWRIMDKLDKLGTKVEKEETKQAALRQGLKDEA